MIKSMQFKQKNSDKNTSYSMRKLHELQDTPPTKKNSETNYKLRLHRSSQYTLTRSSKTVNCSEKAGENNQGENLHVSEMSLNNPSVQFVYVYIQPNTLTCTGGTREPTLCVCVYLRTG